MADEKLNTCDNGCDCFDYCGDDPKVQRGQIAVCSYGQARIARQKFESDALKACAGMSDPVAEIAALQRDAIRYRWLRSRDLDTINAGGIFAGMTPQNIVLNEGDLDAAIDHAMKGGAAC